MLWSRSLAADTVLYARVVRRLKGREWFVSQLLYTASVNAATWPVVAALHCSGRLAPHNWRFPKWKMVAIAAMGTGGNLLGSCTLRVDRRNGTSARACAAVTLPVTPRAPRSPRDVPPRLATRRR